MRQDALPTSDQPLLTTKLQLDVADREEPRQQSAEAHTEFLEWTVATTNHALGSLRTEPLR